MTDGYVRAFAVAALLTLAALLCSFIVSSIRNRRRTLGADIVQARPTEHDHQLATDFSPEPVMHPNVTPRISSVNSLVVEPHGPTRRGCGLHKRESQARRSTS
jgi:hypothetical protein